MLFVFYFNGILHFSKPDDALEKVLDYFQMSLKISTSGLAGGAKASQMFLQRTEVRALNCATH